MFKSIFNIPCNYINCIPFSYFSIWNDINSEKSKEYNCYSNLKKIVLKNNGLISKIDINEIDENNRTIKLLNNIEVNYL